MTRARCCDCNHWLAISDPTTRVEFTPDTHFGPEETRYYHADCRECCGLLEDCKYINPHNPDHCTLHDAYRADGAA